MSRFYVNVESLDIAAITGSDYNHIKNVLRMPVGGTLTICDGKGTDYEGVIESYGRSEARVRILSSQKNVSEPGIRVTLFQGIPKAGKMDGIIMKAVELGVFSIVPLMTARTVVRFDNGRDKAAKRDRWQKIAVEAAKQCNRGIIPEVSEPVCFLEAFAGILQDNISIMPYENEKKLRLSEYLKHLPVPPFSGISLFIGPEGGFADEEAAAALEFGAVHVSLGPRILRTETAGIAAVSVIMSCIGEM